jgi:hypothetical protein
VRPAGPHRTAPRCEKLWRNWIGLPSRLGDITPAGPLHTYAGCRDHGIAPAPSGADLIDDFALSQPAVLPTDVAVCAGPLQAGT